MSWVTDRMRAAKLPVSPKQLQAWADALDKEEAARLPNYVVPGQLRLAILVGYAWASGATRPELERIAHIILGETTARPQIRSAEKNRPIGTLNRRYADLFFGLNLIHWENVLPETEPERSTKAAELTRELMTYPAGFAALLRLMRTIDPVWHSEDAVKRGIGKDGAIKHRTAAEVLTQLDALIGSSTAPIPLETQLAPLEAHP